MSDNLKTQLISAGNTFISTFLSVAVATLSAGTIQWSWAFWGALGLVAVRAGIKAVINSFVPVALGGRK